MGYKWTVKTQLWSPWWQNISLTAMCAMHEPIYLFSEGTSGHNTSEKVTLGHSCMFCLNTFTIHSHSLTKGVSKGNGTILLRKNNLIWENIPRVLVSCSSIWLYKAVLWERNGCHDLLVEPCFFETDVLVQERRKQVCWVVCGVKMTVKGFKVLAVERDSAIS